MRSYRKRHVLFRLHSDGKVTDREIAAAIRESVMSLFGELVVADSRLYIHSFDEATGTGILQVNGAFLEEVLAAAALIESIGPSRVSFNPQRTSGTIRSLLKSTKSQSVGLR